MRIFLYTAMLLLSADLHAQNGVDWNPSPTTRGGIDFPPSIFAAVTNTGSIVGLVKCYSDTGSYGAILNASNTAASYDWTCFFYNNSLYFYLIKSGLQSVITSIGAASITNRHWYAVTWDGSTINVYLDGVLTNTAAQTKHPDTMSAKFVSISRGVDDSASYYLYAKVYDVRAYNRALTAGEVQAIANAYPIGTDGIVSGCVMWMDNFTSQQTGTPILPGTLISDRFGNRGTNVVFTSANGYTNVTTSTVIGLRRAK